MSGESPTQPSVYKQAITERQYYGDVTRNTHRYQNGGSVNENVVLSNTISIVADPFAFENFGLIKYAEFMGQLWKVTSVDIQFPRLILSLGEVYNGETN